MVNGKKSDYFNSLIGVRQGENLSPFLFSIFINDLEDYLIDNGCSPINVAYDDRISDYFKIFVLLYADDTVLLSSSPEGLQKNLSELNKYCDYWKLKANSSKTKVIIFGNRRTKVGTAKYIYNGSELEIIDNFKYLGVLFNFNGNFHKCKKHLYDQANKAMFSLLRKCRRHSLAIDMCIELFDKTVSPILLYGCEVWGYENVDMLERLHLKFCKYVLNIKKCTPNYMVYGELGRYPLSVSIGARMVKYWAKLVLDNSEKYSTKMYKVLLMWHENNVIHSPWLKHVKSIFDKCGLSHVWMDQWVINSDWLKQSVENRLKDQFIQEWSAQVSTSEKAVNYRIYKSEFKFEEYLKILPVGYSKALCKFRTCNHRLPIERGRYRNIARYERYCELCDDNIVGDEYHFILECKSLENLRSQYFLPYYRKNPNTLKFASLFQNTKKGTLIKIAKFIIEGNAFL